VVVVLLVVLVLVQRLKRLIKIVVRNCLILKQKREKRVASESTHSGLCCFVGCVFANSLISYVVVEQ